jgi:signal transduction histidine kinase
MTLRWKALAAMGVFSIIFMGLFAGVSRLLLVSEYTDLETRHTEWHRQTYLSSLVYRVEAISNTAADWAFWDQTYDFMGGSYPDYPRDNLVESSFTSLDLNFILLLEPSGRLAAGRAFDPSSPNEPANLSPVVAAINRDKMLLAPSNAGNGVEGFLDTSAGPALVASQAILSSDRTGPSRGVLVMGRYLDEELLQSLNRATLADGRIYSLSDPGMETDVRVFLETVANGRAEGVRVLDADRIAGYSVVDDVTGKPVMVARVVVPRDIYAQGESTMAWMTLLRVVTGLLLVAGLLYLLDRWLLSRLARLSWGVDEIGSRGDFDARIPVGGNDEISDLGNNINSMLDALVQSRQAVKESENRLARLYEQEKRLRSELQAETEKRSGYTRALVHELKTPLTAMVASSELLMSETKVEPLASLAANIYQGSSNLNERVDELLDIARGEVGLLELDKKPMDVGMLLGRLVAEMYPLAASKKLALIVEGPTRLPVVADEARVRQVVLNLLGNAIKYTPDGGYVTLRGQARQEGVAVEVEDSGRGIPPEEMGQLFEPYHRIKNVAGNVAGLGIGLSLSKMLIELHGGKIWARSELGIGSTFGFLLPY